MWRTLQILIVPVLYAAMGIYWYCDLPIYRMCHLVEYHEAQRVGWWGAYKCESQVPDKTVTGHLFFSSSFCAKGEYTTLLCTNCPNPGNGQARLQKGERGEA